MSDDEIKALALKIDELILLCNQLNMENQSLKRKSLDWQQERSKLIERSALARERLEGMLDKLRDAESAL